MAETTYTYSISTDFTSSGGAFSAESMIVEVKASAIVTALEEGKIKRIDDVVEIVFKDALSSGDETILDGLVAAHTGDPPSPVGDVITTETTSADGTPVFSTQPLQLGRESFKRTDNGTELMNINGLSSGSAVVIWNGTGAGDTGSDWSTSGEGSETAGAMYSGTNGWDTGVTTLDANTRFDNGSMINIAGTYDSLSFWMQPKAVPGGSIVRVAWLDDTDTALGNKPRIDDYTSNMDLDVWQKVTIPIADFGLTGNAQKLQFRYRGQASQQYYFDDIELASSGGTGPYIFRIAAPDANTIYHLSMAVLQIAAPSSAWNRDAFGNILGGIANGLIMRHRRISTSDILWRFVTKTNMELFGQFHPQDDVTFSDGDLLIGFMVKPGKATVTITNDDVLEFVVRDNLTTISEMRAYCHYGVEVTA